MAKIGPTGNLPFGVPMRPGDKGGLYSGFAVLKDARMAAMEFGAEVSWVAMPAVEARRVAKAIRDAIVENFGTMAYDKSQLPIRMVAGGDDDLADGLVHIYLPRTTPAIIANPEFWLAFAERLEEEAAKLKVH